MTPAPTRAPLKVTEAELRLFRLPLVTPFTIATGTTTATVIPLVTLRADGIEGHAEAVMDPLPDYLEETVTGAMALLRDVLLPQVVGQSFAHPQQLARRLQPWRANYMARAAVEMAFWDLWAKSLDLPLRDVLGGEGEAVDVGVSLGIGPIAATLDRVAAHLDQGYRRIKLKVKPGHDIALLAEVRRAFPDAHLTVDANCCYSLADTPLLQRMDDFALDYIEQPLDWDDIHDHATLQSRLRTALCLDECIRTVEHARKALQSDAARVLNIKVGRVGGHAAALAIHDLARASAGLDGRGGVVEAGSVGAGGLRMSTLPGFTRPGDTSSASRYFTRDVVEQRLECVDGRMPVPSGPGIGVTLDRDFLARVSESVERITP